MEKLHIPQQLQGIVDEINNIALDLGEVNIEPHPMISTTHSRALRIVKIIPNLEVPRTDVYFIQVLKDAEGIEIPSNLPRPEWTIHSDETSSLRDENKQRIMLPVLTDEAQQNEFVPKLDAEGNQVLSPLLFNSHKYLVWVLKNNRSGLIELLQGYLQEKLFMEPDFLAKLNSL